MMSRLIKTVLISAYSALFVQFIKSLLTNRNVEIVEIEYITDRQSASHLGHEILKHKRVASVINTQFERLERSPTDYKYVLKWTVAYAHYNSPVFVSGQRPFLDNNCSHTNCFMTNDKTILPDPRYYDAILFDVENYWDFHPVMRSPYQHFIFLAQESAHNFPVCYKDADNYYNLTWTYRIDSDIRWSYVTILDKNGTFAGPKVDMNWVEPMLPTPDDVKKITQGKNKTVAWFVSSCGTKSQRQKVAEALQDELAKYDFEMDIYGWCGKLRCPRDKLDECLKILERDYYFYLAFENSLAEDYVTEKVLYPLLHHTVPVVYGGANYSRFLPPGSYIDAGALDAKTVAAKMFEAITTPEVYNDYFKWHNHYTYIKNPGAKDVCQLCEILNAPLTFSAKKDFRKWWNSKKTNKEICNYTSAEETKITEHL